MSIPLRANAGRILENLTPKASAPAPVGKDDEEKLAWTTINPATLPKPLAALYAAKREADAAAREAREALESAMSSVMEELPPNAEYKFGYRFGQLSFAIGPKAAPKAAKGAVSFTSLTRR